MKIIIKDNKVNLTIPVPMILVSNGKRLEKFIHKYFIKEDTPEKTKEIINSIDMDLIAFALKELKGYKGMEILEVVGKEGRYVSIKI